MNTNDVFESVIAKVNNHNQLKMRIIGIAKSSLFDRFNVEENDPETFRLYNLILAGNAWRKMANNNDDIFTSGEKMAMLDTLVKQYSDLLIESETDKGIPTYTLKCDPLWEPFNDEF